jgi:hypothetical protein
MEEVTAVEHDQRHTLGAQAVDEGGPPGQPTLLAVSPTGHDLALEAALRKNAQLHVGRAKAGIRLRTPGTKGAVLKQYRGRGEEPYRKQILAPHDVPLVVNPGQSMEMGDIHMTGCSPGSRRPSGPSIAV